MTTAPSAPADAATALPAATEEPSPARAGSGAVAARIAPWVELTKPRITLLLLVTCVAAMLCAERGMPDLWLLAVTGLGLALSSGGASALNHVLDRDIDALMRRTATRPVVTGAVSPLAGAAFGIALMVMAGAVLAAGVSTLTAVLALAGGAFYVIVYTLLLKRTTAQNIVIGGAAGAVPPLVGWSAVTGDVGVLAWELFLIVFMWTPPHFWALALLIREDYDRAGVPMLPVTAGEHRTVIEIVVYAVLLVASTLLPVATGDLGVLYAVCAVVLGSWLLARCVRLWQAAREAPAEEALVQPGSAGHAAARAVFLASMLYLALLFAAAVLDRTSWHQPLL